MSSIVRGRGSCWKRENPLLKDIGALLPNRKRKHKKRKRHHPPVPFRTPKYATYINGNAWRKKREAAFQFYGRKCNRCSATTDLQVHHRNYKRVGRERMADLEILCGGCHANEHEGKVVGVYDPMTLEYLSLNL